MPEIELFRADFKLRHYPLLNKLDFKIESENVKVFSQFKIEVTIDSIKAIPLSQDIDLNIPLEVLEDFLNAANALEAFATYFTSGVADEKLACLSIGKTFCDSVKNLAPILVLSRNDGRHFTAALSLLSIWNTRLEKEKLSKQKEKIEEQLKKQHSVKINTVGTDT